MQNFFARSNERAPFFFSRLRRVARNRGRRLSITADSREADSCRGKPCERRSSRAVTRSTIAVECQGLLADEPARPIFDLSSRPFAPLDGATSHSLASMVSGGSRHGLAAFTVARSPLGLRPTLRCAAAVAAPMRLGVIALAAARARLPGAVASSAADETPSRAPSSRRSRATEAGPVY